MPYRYTPISDRTGRPPLGGAKRDPPEGGSIPGLLGVRARTPGTRGCTFLRVFNNSPSRDSLGHFFGSRNPPSWAAIPGGLAWAQVGRVIMASHGGYGSHTGAAASRTLAGHRRGGTLATGTRWPALRPVGGTCVPEGDLPQGKDGSLRRGVRS